MFDIHYQPSNRIDIDSLYRFLQSKSKEMDQLYTHEMDDGLTLLQSAMLPRIITALAVLNNTKYLPTYDTDGHLSIDIMSLSDELLAEGVLNEDEVSMMRYVRHDANQIKHCAFEAHTANPVHVEQNFQAYSKLLDTLDDLYATYTMIH